VSRRLAESTAAGTSLAWDHTLGAGDNRILIVCVGVEDTEQADLVISDVTYNGTAMTHVSGSSGRAGTSFLAWTDIYYLLDAGLPGAGTYQVEVTTVGETADIEAAAISITGGAQEAPETAAGNSNEDGSPISTDVTRASL